MPCPLLQGGMSPSGGDCSATIWMRFSDNQDETPTAVTLG